MEDKEIKRLFRQAGDSLQAIFEYFRLQNKVLWSTTSDWNSGSRTIADLKKYKTFVIYPYTYLTGVLCEWDGDIIRGAGVVEGVSTTITATVSFEFALKVSGNTVTISKAQYVLHNGANHSSGAANIKKIVGIEPVLPTTLQSILRGGVLHNKKRWCAA